MNKGIVVLGAQWGDEGKGKLVDLLINEDVKYVVRYQGGDNAGHTLSVNSKKIVLHVIPSGILHDHIVNVIANGVVLSPFSLIKEMSILKSAGLDISGRILISKFCPMVLPYHVAIDNAREKFKNNVDIIGTTGRGIGPAYEDKAARRALRIVDLYDEVRFSNILKKNIDYYNFQLSNYYHVDIIDYEKVLFDIFSVSNILLDMAVDTCSFLNHARKRGDIIIFEGAQGTLLDVDHGIYPYVTSSNTISSAVSSGTGVVLHNSDYILGVLKSYATRVGFGPFPTELFDSIGEFLCISGNEFGSTTGRRRRTGWFDTVIVRHSVQINDFSGMFLTKLDVLDGLEEIKICVGYRLKNGTVTNAIPSVLKEWENIEPVYEVFSGWDKSSTVGIQDFDQLPEAARFYVKRIEEIISVPIDIISTGPNRHEVIILRDPFHI